MSKKIVTFGEIMLKLTPPDYQRFIQAEKFDVTYGGGEANVAASAAHYGLDPYFVTKLPDNPIGQSALNHMRRYGINTDLIPRGGDRLGIYFCEIGASQRPSNVIYDRANSAIAEAEPEDFDWDAIFKDAEWFHFTGITPALSDKATKVTKKALEKAKEFDITVSCDLNYRAKLWSTDKANRVMSELMEYVDVCIANEEDSEKVFGIESGSDIESGELDIEAYKNVAEELVNRFDFDYVGSHLRESYTASDNGWSIIFYDGQTFYQSEKYEIHIVDRVGGGDSFAAGIIYGFLSDMSLEDTVEFAAAASCLKHSIHGDFNMVTVDEVKQLAEGSGSGRVKR